MSINDLAQIYNFLSNQIQSLRYRIYMLEANFQNQKTIEALKQELQKKEKKQKEIEKQF